MYLRCSFESKPAWNGKSRALFQNKSNHKPANMSRSICCSRSAVDSLELTFQRKLTTEAIAIRTIQNGQSFLIASNVSSPPAMELPGPGLFAADASAA